MISCRISLLLVLLVFGAAPLCGQVSPVPQDHSKQDRMRYHAEVFRECQEVLREWTEAWSRGDARATARFYVDEATLVPTGGQIITGRQTIERQLQELLPRRRDIRTALVDFEVHGNILYGLGTFSYETERAGGRTETVNGNYVVVMRRSGRTWRIRSQVFTPITPELIAG